MKLARKTSQRFVGGNFTNRKDEFEIFLITAGVRKYGTWF